jgi:hypothetical protein
MKKSPKKLNLTKETLRALEEAERGDAWLQKIAAGYSYTCVQISACWC